ncbi:hypothetical protein BP00DRAFT_268994 [Aspergillus indologenus CBS 114.80]|uniref:Uncharacterized protein n=1 Tax=Aspergillus indologenus CBS 114.80 TaxID=1450541 RepID=A0A2V5IEX3_9EURO|nr:hypothetical protein BP00DRAFT_268994 [Aspergillus indologenus CBS 114.80]
MLQLHCELLYRRASIGLSLPAGVSSSTVRPDTTPYTVHTLSRSSFLSPSLPLLILAVCSFPSPPSFAAPPSGFLTFSLSFFPRCVAFSPRPLVAFVPSPSPSPSTADLTSCTTAILFAPEN